MVNVFGMVTNMSFPQLTPQLLDRFFDLIINEATCVSISPSDQNKVIYCAYELFKKQGHTKWHLVQYSDGGINLWRRNDWLRAEEKRKQDEFATKLYNEILEERRDAFNKIRRGICELLGIDPNNQENLNSVSTFAEKAMKNKTQGAKDLTGVDLDKIKDLPENKPHRVMGKEGYVL